MQPSDYVWCYIFILPFLVLSAALTIWPAIRTVQFSFYDYNGIGLLDDFVGLKNYFDVIQDPVFVVSFVNTLLFAVVQSAIKLPLSFLIAVLLTRPWLKGRELFRTVFFLPLLVPIAIGAMVFQFLLNPANGALNALLIDLHLITKPINFFETGARGLLTIALISVWQILGQYVIYWMAALQSVPEEIYEAAEIDGANDWQKMIYITLPMIRPIAVIITCLGLVWALSMFDLVYILTGGGPGTQSYVMSLFIFNNAFGRSRRYGVASAAAFIFGLCVLIVFTVLQGLIRRAQQQRQEYGV